MWHEIVALVICNIAIAVAVVWLFRKVICRKNKCRSCDKEECPLHGASHKESKKEK